MPKLRWDISDFIECLEVLPQTDEFETNHFFQVAKDGLKLEISVWLYESIVSIDLYRDGIELPIVGCAFLVRGEIKLAKEKNSEWLEIGNCIIIPDRFSFMDSRRALFDVHQNPYGLTVEILVTPHFRIGYHKR